MFAKYFIVQTIVLVYLVKVAYSNDVSVDTKNVTDLCVTDYNLGEKVKESDRNIFDKLDKITEKMDQINGRVDDINRDVVRSFDNISKRVSATDVPSEDISILDIVLRIEKRLMNMENELQNIVQANFESNKKIDEAFDKVNQRLYAIENVSQKGILTKLDNLTYAENVSYDVKPLSNDLLPQLTNNITKFTNEIILVSQNMNNLKTFCRTKQESVETDKTALNVLNVRDDNKITADKGDEIKDSWCRLRPNLASSVNKNDTTTIWQEWKTPGQDMLDGYMVNKTGCKHVSLGYWDDVFHFTNVTLEGAALVQRLAVRASEGAGLRMVWKNSPDQGTEETSSEYVFNIGYDTNQFSHMSQYNPYKRLTSVYNPDILSRDKYIPFYVKLDARAGTLSFGMDCDTCPLFRLHDVTVSRGSRVQMEFYAVSFSGAKLLVCRADGAGST